MLHLHLENEFGILCRPGLHCAPLAHKTIGTFPEGTIRFSLSYLNSEGEVDQALQAVSHLAGKELKHASWCNPLSLYPLCPSSGKIGQGEGIPREAHSRPPSPQF